MSIMLVGLSTKQSAIKSATKSLMASHYKSEEYSLNINLRSSRDVIVQMLRGLALRFGPNTVRYHRFSTMAPQIEVVNFVITCDF